MGLISVFHKRFSMKLTDAAFSPFSDEKPPSSTQRTTAVTTPEATSAVAAAAAAAAAALPKEDEEEKTTESKGEEKYCWKQVPPFPPNFNLEIFDVIPTQKVPIFVDFLVNLLLR